MQNFLPDSTEERHLQHTQCRVIGFTEVSHYITYVSYICAFPSDTLWEGTVHVKSQGPLSWVWASSISSRTASEVVFVERAAWRASLYHQLYEEWILTAISLWEQNMIGEGVWTLNCTIPQKQLHHHDRASLQKNTTPTKTEVMGAFVLQRSETHFGDVPLSSKPKRENKQHKKTNKIHYYKGYAEYYTAYNNCETANSNVRKIRWISSNSWKDLTVNASIYHITSCIIIFFLLKDCWSSTKKAQSLSAGGYNL